MFLKSIISFVLIAQAVRASPVTKRTGEISCSSKVFAQGPLSLEYAPEGGYQYFPVTEFTSPAGQNQIQITTDTSAPRVNVIIRECNSTALNFHYSENYYPGFTPVKIFLADDESKCLQRHADLHSNDPNAKTHIVIDDCSNVDDGNQAKQFWDDYQPYQVITPVVVRNGREQDVDLVLSNGNSGQVLATTSPGSATQYVLTLHE